MKQIPDELLLESYLKARKLNLSQEFLKLIELELKKRSLLKLVKIS